VKLPRFLRVVEAGPRLVVELPWLLEDPGGFAEVFRSNLLRYEVSIGARTVAEGETVGHFEVDLRGEASGAYRVELRSRGRVIWKQDIFAQPRLSRTPAQVDALARELAPVLLFSAKEEYFPVSLATLIGAPAVKASDDTVEVKTVHGELQVPLAQLSEFLRYNGHADYLLDQSAFDAEKVFDEVRGDCHNSTVYYSYLEEEQTGRAFLNFHTFYAFDPKTGIAKLLGVGPHVFDRESLSFVIGREGEPECLVVSGHLEGQRILFFDSLKFWSEGRVRMSYPDEKIAAVKGHALIPVAEGSHALYPSPGMYHISVLAELAGHVLGPLCSLLGIDPPAEESLAPHQVLLPPGLRSDRFASYTLRPLRFDLLRSEPLPESALYDPASAALVFSGYWVDVPGLANERFPPFSSREVDPGPWCDEAYPWNWDELPASLVEHNLALAHAIEAEIKC